MKSNTYDLENLASLEWQVIRGGAYDYSAPDCRSARRLFFGNHPALNDSDLGFRVVLVIKPQ